MTTKQCIEELRKMREDYNHRFYTANFPNPAVDKAQIECDILDELIERLEKLPEDDGWISAEKQAS